MRKQNWLITGVSTGLGRAFAQAALAAGHTVVGTVRSENDLRAFEELGASEELGTAEQLGAVEGLRAVAEPEPGRALGRILDVTDDDAVASVITEVERSVGPLDVVIANAGYGLEGTFEETPLAEVRRQFEVNVFGAAATLRAALPHMRERRRGHLMAVTSMGGLMAVPGMSAYCGSKFALEGILEALGKEVAQFGIHVTAIEPGSFRTDWAGRSMTRAERSIDDYDELFTPIREGRQKASGNQLGDPVKAGEAVVRIASVDQPPAHLILGSDALRLVGTARTAVDEDIRAWEALSRTTDFAEGAQL
ncbi:oxidoreductase [Streptomyces sp. NPDC050610]|uniref:oxidoreductase n=1 Tax=Streptomyces sp. NPDC050610 TaxID=3157097 RepID=UPI00341E0E0A